MVDWTCCLTDLNDDWSIQTPPLYWSKNNRFVFDVVRQSALSCQLLVGPHGDRTEFHSFLDNFYFKTTIRIYMIFDIWFTCIYVSVPMDYQDHRWINFGVKIHQNPRFIQF